LKSIAKLRHLFHLAKFIFSMSEKKRIFAPHLMRKINNKLTIKQ